MVILGKIAATFAFLFGIIFLYFPGGFGVLHFNQGRPRLVALAVSTLWILFMLAHVVAIFRTWLSHDRVYIWLIALFVAQLIFFNTIATDVSTR